MISQETRPSRRVCDTCQRTSVFVGARHPPAPCRWCVQAGITHAILDQWHVLITIVVVVEASSRNVRVHHANLDHTRSPRCKIFDLVIVPG